MADPDEAAAPKTILSLTLELRHMILNYAISDEASDALVGNIMLCRGGFLPIGTGKLIWTLWNVNLPLRSNMKPLLDKLLYDVGRTHKELRCAILYAKPDVAFANFKAEINRKVRLSRLSQTRDALKMMLRDTEELSLA